VVQCLKKPAALDYIIELQRAVVRAWEVPKDAPSDLCAVISITLAQDGTLGSELDFVTSSTGSFDSSVLAAFAKALPIRPIPPGAECLIGLPLEARLHNPGSPSLPRIF
jgi:hypothetical protein